MPAKYRDAPGVLISVRTAGKDKTEPLDLGDRFISLSFEDDEKKAAKASIVIDNFDLKFFDDETIVPGSLLDVTWGYSGLVSQTQHLVVKTIEGGTTLKIEAESMKQLMNREHNNRSFDQMKRSDVARAIATEHGFTSDKIFIDDTKVVHETIVQARMTDSQFLRHLANKEGFEWWMDETGFHFHERKFGDPPVKRLIYYIDQEQGDIVNFSIKESTNAKAGRVEAKGVSPDTKETFDAKADNESEEKTSLVEFVAVPGGVGIKKVTANKPSGTKSDNVSSTDVMPTSEEDAESVARAASGRYKRSAANGVELSLNIVGDPEITAKCNIEVLGIGKSFSGLYYVTNAKTNITSGSEFQLALKCKREGRNSGIAGVPAEGEVNKEKAPDDGDTELTPQTVFEPGDSGTGLVKKTVYK